MGMRSIIETLLTVLEYFSLGFVAYFGIKYLFVAGPIFFGSVWGIIVASIMSILFICHVFKTERREKL